jgi:hypothetical protein
MSPGRCHNRQLDRPPFVLDQLEFGQAQQGVGMLDFRDSLLQSYLF